MSSESWEVQLINTGHADAESFASINTFTSGGAVSIYWARRVGRRNRMRRSDKRCVCEQRIDN